MLTAARALRRNIDSGKPLPQIPELRDLYRYGTVPRLGQMMMVAGRSGTQKSGFALWFTAKLGLPTLYFSADMSGFTASCRLASMFTGDSQEAVEANMAAGQRSRYDQALRSTDITFAFGKPITWNAVDDELAAYVELHDAWPSVICVDNLMDFEGGEADYAAQMENMQILDGLKSDTGATVIVLHHATDKSWESKSDPWSPPSREQIKGGMSEKPELVLSVGLDPRSGIYRIATLKQRMGPSDPTGQTSVMLRAYPSLTRFGPYQLEGDPL